jgi:catechol 2,3-dioxygenase-like lactoylglutathione lyase family enzyme
VPAALSDQLRRLAVWVLCIAAGAAIVLVLSGEELDETAARAVLTAIAVSLYSLTASAGMALGRHRPDLAWFGWLQVLVSAFALFAALPTTWMDDPGEGPLKLSFCLLIAALAGGHASLILRSRPAAASPSLGLVQAGTLGSLAVLSILGIVAIARDDVGEPRILAVFAILYVLGSVLIPIVRRSAPERGPAGIEVDHVVIAVSDWDRSKRFYREVLGAEPVELPRGRSGFRIGDVLLTAHGPGSQPTLDAANPLRPGGSDLCFRWPGSAEEAMRHLGERGVDVVEGPVTRVGAAGSGTSLYFRDPDGSLLELISYDS